MVQRCVMPRSSWQQRREPGRHVGEAANVGIMSALQGGFFDFVVWQAAKNFLEYYLRFEARQRRTETGVHTVTERHVLPGAATDVKALRVVELVGVAISRDHTQSDAIALPQQLTP